jgi:gliding motility-associated-like protein
MMNNQKTILLLFILAWAGGCLFGQVADFQMNKTEACDSIIVTFTNKSLPSATSTINDYTFTWNFGRPFTTSAKDTTIIKTDTTKFSFKFKKAGEHYITLSMAHNTKSSEKASVKDSIFVHPHPNAWFSVADTFQLGALTYRFRSGKAPTDTMTYKYIWRLNPDAKSNIIDTSTIAIHLNAKELRGKSHRDTLIRTFNTSGLYRMYLIVSDNLKCTDKFDTSFHVSDKLVVPKFFSPNGDGKNDYFSIETNGRDVYHFEVFTSRGQRIFSSESPSIMWDGIIEDTGKPAIPGTYYYYIEPVNGGNDKTSGFFVLFRDK